MKKIVLSILGIFALVACSEDVYQDIDKQNNGLEAANTASNDGSGANAPFTLANTYHSPWDIDNIAIPVKYTIENTTNINPGGRLIFRVTPYVGLAYFDTLNDGVYRNGKTQNPIVNFTTAPVGTYPNLYDITNNEIGNFIPAQPIILDGTAFPGQILVEIESLSDHCPVDPAVNPANNPNNEHFNILASGATTQEESLLKEYGKVFFFFWEAIDPATNMVVDSRYVTPFCYNRPYNTVWKSTLVSVNVPNVVPPIDLYYNVYSEDSTMGEGSYEVVFDQSSFSYPYFTPFLYNGYYYEVKTTVDVNGMYIYIKSFH